MKEHTKWWRRVYVALIKNKTRREVSEITWQCCLEWVQAEAMALALNNETDFDDAALFELSQIISTELES